MEAQELQAIQPRHARRRRLLITLGSVAGLIIAVPVAYTAYLTFTYYVEIKSGVNVTPDERRMQASISAIQATETVDPSDLERLVPRRLAPVLGTKGARITIVEFLDYECPFCQKNAPAVRRILEEREDDVRLYIRDYPLTDIHPHARDVAHAANCVLEQGQAGYWRFHDQTFSDQTKLSLDDLRATVARIQADLEEYDQCMQEQRYDRKIDEDIELGIRVGVQGTPTFFVNGVRFQGVMDEEDLNRVIDFFIGELPR